MKFSNLKFFSVIAFFFLILNITCLNKLRGLNQEKLSSDLVGLEANTQANSQTSSSNETKDSFYSAFAKEVNSTFVTKSFEEMQYRLRDPSFYLKDIQIRDIFHHMSSSRDGKVTRLDLQSFFRIFVNPFSKCAVSNKNLISIEEFRTCFKKDPYLKEIQLPKEQLGFAKNYSSSEAGGMPDILFSLLDENQNQGLSFYDYFNLRIIRYGWIKCSPNKATIEEANFECVMNTISGFKKLEHNTLKALFELGISLSFSRGRRDLDFGTFAQIAHSVRLYALINGKEDKEMTERELTAALEQDVLPSRYNKETITELFKLVKDDKYPLRGIDLVSFVYYDYYLRIFDKPDFYNQKNSPRYINKTEFTSIIKDNFLIPGKIRFVIENIVQLKELTPATFSMDMQNKNNPKYLEEKDFFRFEQRINFTDISEKSTAHIKDYPGFGDILFDLCDTRNIREVDFYDFGSFIQISDIFATADSLYRKGKLTATQLYSSISNHNAFPIIQSKLRDWAKLLTTFPKTSYFDLFTTLAVLRSNDNAQPFLRGTNSLEEIEIKELMKKMHLNNVPDDYLQDCKRGNGERGVELFDWECSVIEAIKAHLDFINNQINYITTSSQNLNLTRTEFENTSEKLKLDKS